MIMTRESFRDTGERILGYGWQTKLARALNTDGRTVRRWALGEVPVPESVVACLELLDVIDRHTIADRPARWPTARD